MRHVVTWSAPGGFDTIDICLECEAAQRAVHDWPRTDGGVEYCQVSYGLHRGTCDLCGEGQSEADELTQELQDLIDREDGR